MPGLCLVTAVDGFFHTVCDADPDGSDDISDGGWHGDPVHVQRRHLQRNPPAVHPRLRVWARARQLDAGSWGLLGGFTWALLTA